MDSKKAQSCLKTFLEVSKIQIGERNSEIRGLERQKAIAEVGRKSLLNERISVIIRERDKVQGRLDSVRLEILDMILDNPSLVSDKLIQRKGYSSIVDFVKGEKETIELRGLHEENPCSIAEVLNIGLSSQKDEGFSLFEERQTEATESDVKSAVNDRKVVKTMIKSM